METALGVSFQQVVHPVRTGETEVATLQGSTGEPDEHPSECPTDADGSSADRMAASRPIRLRSACASRRRMGHRLGWPTARRVPSRLRRPTPAGHRQQIDRAAAPAAHRHAHRQDRRGLARHRQPDPHRAGLSRLKDLEPAEPVRRYERAASGRTHPSRHQEARPLRTDRPSHHRRPHRASPAAPAAPAGSSSMSASTMPPASPSRRSCRTRRKRAPSPSSRPPSPITKPRRHRHPGHDRQRRLLQSRRLRQRLPRLGLRHIRTRPYTPKTNGKAERFIQTALREWAYATALPDLASPRPPSYSLAPPLQLAPTPRQLKGNTPISRLRLTEDNLLRLHI